MSNVAQLEPVGSFLGIGKKHKLRQAVGHEMQNVKDMISVRQIKILKKLLLRIKKKKKLESWVDY